MTLTEKRKHMRLIFRGVAASHGLEEADLYVRDRSPRFVSARHAAWAQCRAVGFVCQDIADLGGWDCSTVIGATNKKQARPTA
jgi:hypothetical protein